jgi:coatomer subunit beta'
VVTQFQTYVVEGNLAKAHQLLPQIPQKYLDKVAKFLDSMDLKEEAFEIAQDIDHK